MKIHSYQTQQNGFAYSVASRLDRIFSPLIGLSQEIGYLKRSSVDPRLITIGGGITGVHQLLNRPDPGKGGYHIGGVGFFHNEAMIKTLAESLERYSQLMSEFTLQNQLERKFLSYNQMKTADLNVLDEQYLNLFDSEQHLKTGFPFDPFDPDLPMTWVKVKSLDQKQEKWLPAQFLFIGYSCIRPEEPWLLSAVTTGTAAHSTKKKALISATSELIQIDAAMTHWYTDSPAIPLKLDDRVHLFLKFMNKVMNSYTDIKPIFYWLKNKDLPGFNIACVFEREGSHIPRFAVGLGSDWSLERALYKAFLEGYGVVGLARLNVFKEKTSLDGLPLPENTNQSEIYDLDSNVAQYAKGHHAEIFKKKFRDNGHLQTKELPKDWVFDHEDECIKFIIDSFHKTHKELFFVDITSPEAENLGFHIARVWSPDTLQLCLPSAVPKNHPRFKSSLGVTHEFPHPYP